MTYSKKYLEELIQAGMYVDIPREIVNESFPHYERPTKNEMEFAVNSLIRDKAVPEELMVKIESKPTAEMLKDFCAKRGLSCEFDSIELVYRFRLKRFKNGQGKLMGIIDVVRILLARIQDEKDVKFWHRKPLTDLEETAQALAKLVPPE